MRSKALPSKGPHSPFSVGGRTLLARTCIRCGVLADGESFPILNRGTKNQARRKTCHDCTNAMKKQGREERGIGLPFSRPPEELQTNKRRQWTKDEDDYLREHITQMGYMDIAIALGRSVDSIYTRRGILGLARVRPSHRVKQPWRIEQ